MGDAPEDGTTKNTKKNRTHPMLEFPGVAALT